MKNIVIAIMLFLCTATPGYSFFWQKDVPVKVSFRKAVFENSLVAKLWNSTKDKHLAVIVTLKNDTTNEKMRGVITLGPNETKEIGWAQGWSFFSGETIKIEHSGYSSVTIKVP